MAEVISGTVIVGQKVGNIANGKLCIHVEDSRLADASAVPVKSIEMLGINHSMGEDTQLPFLLTVTDDNQLSHLSVRAVLHVHPETSTLQTGDCVTTQHYAADDSNLTLELKQI